MLRIVPNNPENGRSNFIFGFTDNETFSKAEKKDRITLIVNASNLNNSNILENLYKVNITTDQVIKKYGDIKVLYIQNL